MLQFLTFCQMMVIIKCLVPCLAVKDNSSVPPPDFLSDMILDYLDVKDVVLCTHEDTNFPVTEYVSSLYRKNIFTSVYEWKSYEPEKDQFDRFIHVVESGKQQTIVFFMDALSTQIFYRFAHLVKEVLPLPCFYRWIFFDVNGTDVEPLHRFNTSAVCWKALYITQKNDSDSENQVWSVYGPTLTPYGNCNITDNLGNWSTAEDNRQLRHPEVRITDFGNRGLKTAVVDEQPFYKLTEDGYEGIEYELIKSLRTKLNFRIIVVNRTDPDFGRQLPSGAWTGFIGLVHNGSALFTVATLSINSRRMTSVDFSSPYFFSKVGFVVMNPALQPRKLVLIKPFTPDVWISLVCTFIACIGALYLITHSLPCKSGIRRSYNIWFLLRAFGQQGTPSPAPARYSIRFFISSWWFFTMVILWSYAGSLTSFMTNPGRRPAVDTVQKLLHGLISRNIHYGTVKGTTYENFLKLDMAEIHPIFRDSLLENPDYEVDSLNDGMNLVLKENYALVFMSMVIKWYAATMGLSLFRISKNVFSSEAIGIAIQKCHPCKKSFDHIIDRLEETGFFCKWYDDAFVKATIQAPLQTVQNVRALSLDDLQGAFYFGGIGLGLSTIVFMFEVVISKISNARSNRADCSKGRKRNTKRKRKIAPSPIVDWEHYLNYH